jgi:hypothetical protein
MKREVDGTADRAEIAAIEDVATLIGMIVASCNCMTKTPEVAYHSEGCRYRLVCERLEEVREQQEFALG